MVEKPCSQCWHKGRWSTCRHPYAEIPTGGSYLSRIHMRTGNFVAFKPPDTMTNQACGIQGHLWLKLPPLFIPRFKYWLMSRRQKTQWANAVASLMQQPEEEAREDLSASVNIGTQAYPIRQARPKPNPYNHP